MTKSFTLLLLLVLASVKAISQQFELLQPSSFTALSRCSSDFGDYDNDGDLDILISGRTGPTTFFTKIYRNDGNDTFSEVDFNLHNKEFGTSMWGDYNNDGYLDIILVGQDIADQYLTRVYRNEQGTQFEEVQLNLESFYHLFSSWIDFDGDGSLDISITTGSSSHGGQILQNSDGTFKPLNVNLPSIQGDQSMTYADFDFDGDIDLLYPNTVYINENWAFRDSTVTISSGGNKSWIDYDSDGDLDILSNNILYENQAGTIIQNSFNFNGIGSASWGDFDGDDDLDLLLATNVYRNLGGGDFELLADDLNNSGEMHWGQLWADIDNDNDLDILYGDRLYKNLDNMQSGNTNIPNNLSANYASETETIHFAWTAPEFSNKFSFNYFLLDHDKEVIIAPSADTTNGFRRLVRDGNVGKKLHHSRSTNDLGIGKFYWAIQSIDNRYLGSPFSSMDSFEIKPEINGEIADQNCLGSNATLTLNGTFDESVSFDIRAEGADILTVSYNQFSFSWETSGFKQIEIIGIQNGASSDTLKLSIEVLNPPIITLSDLPILCQNDSLHVAYVYSPTNNVGLNWSVENGEIVQSLNSDSLISVLWDNFGQNRLRLQVTDLTTGCISDTTITVATKKSPTADFTVQSQLCDGESALIIYNGNGADTANYSWNFDGGTILSGEGAGPYEVNWDSFGSKSISLSVSENGCSSESFAQQINYSQYPLLSFSSNESTCYNENYEITFTGSNFTDLDWNFGDANIISGTESGPYILNWSSSGTKLINLVAGNNGCSKDSTIVIEIPERPYTPDICLVTVDEASSKNMLVWDYDLESVTQFGIYRETNVSGEYSLIEYVDGGLSNAYIDTQSSPEQQSNRYKITSLDSCGTETDLSSFHKTIHLTINQGIGNSWNLIWDGYEGFSFGTYRIYRSLDGNSFELLTEIASNLTSFTDTDVPSFDVAYQIEVVTSNICFIDQGGRANQNSVSQSNIARNSNVLGTNSIGISIEVYPNPTSDYLNINGSFDRLESYELFTLTGQLVQVGDLTAKHIINMKGLSSGIYLLKVHSNEDSTIKRIVKK